MAGEPITWRNVSGPSLTDAFRPMQAAQQTIMGGLDTFQNMIKQQETVDRANWQQQKENNTNEFLNQLMAAKGPEGFKQLQESGQLAQMLQGFGAQIDQAQARTAMDNRMGVLQDRAVKDITYKNTTLEDAQAPEIRRLQTLALTDPKAAQAELAKSPDMLKAFEVAKLIDSQGQILVDRDRASTRFGWEADKVPLELQGLRLGNESKGIQNKLGNLQVTEAKQRVDDNTTTRALENTIAAAAAQHSADREVAGKAQGALASRLNLPLDARGFADLSNYSADQLKLFDQNARLAGVPLTATTLSGDTQRADRFYDDLNKSGKFPARLLRSNEAGIRSAFNSPIGERGLVGNDAFNATMTRAQNQVGFDRQDASNWYAPNSQDARRSYDDLANKLPDIVKSMPAGTWFGDNQKDIPALQGMLGEIASTGIRRKDGTYVTPSANDVLRFIRSEEGGFRDAKRAEDVRKKLEEWIDSPEAIDMAKKGLESQKWRDKEKVRQILYPDTSGAKK